MSRRRVVLTLILSCFGAQALAQSSAGDAPRVAIKGYDPVAYFVDGRPVKGLPAFAYDFDDSRYYFSSAKNRGLFSANPDRYAPQFAGLCAAGLADGRVVESDPTAFVVRGGRLYLFQAAKGVERALKDPALLTKAHQLHPAK